MRLPGADSIRVSRGDDSRIKGRLTVCLNELFELETKASRPLHDIMSKLGWVAVMKLMAERPAERVGDPNHRAMPPWHRRSALLCETCQAVTARLVP